MGTVSLANRRAFMLPPIHVPELGLDEHVIGVNERDGKTGVTGMRKTMKLLPRAVTLCARGTPGDRVPGLPEAAASSPEVVAAKNRGDLAVEVDGAAPPSATPAVPAEE